MFRFVIENFLEPTITLRSCTILYLFSI